MHIPYAFNWRDIALDPALGLTSSFSQGLVGTSVSALINFTILECGFPRTKMSTTFVGTFPCILAGKDFLCGFELEY